MWIPLGALGMLNGSAKRLGEAWRRLALPLAIVIASAHMAKSLEKNCTWAGYLPHALTEPTGIQTAMKMQSKFLALPQPLVNYKVISICSTSSSA